MNLSRPENVATAIDTLMEEHRLFTRLLPSLWSLAHGLSAAPEQRARLSSFVEFAMAFADGLHHQKEEEVLFAALAAQGFPVDDGPLGVVFAEHEELRRCVSTLRAGVRQATPWSADDLRRLGGAAATWVEVLRQHIAKEDNVLFPLVQRQLPAALLAEVDERCRLLDRATQVERRRLWKLGEELAALPSEVGAPVASP